MTFSGKLGHDGLVSISYRWRKLKPIQVKSAQYKKYKTLFTQFNPVRNNTIQQTKTITLQINPTRSDPTHCDAVQSNTNKYNNLIQSY